ncbi:hypothetical protein [Photobacterium atrarenae]|uniref:Right handed beta helix domain-containing protein n=1 Tax=Photobacterium atrarenae TaxID=865757 RepID=A0ABY5GQR7_9GAMM|nr:hypothetical protein [Photobacterium atrarenae]UTV30867.1 hypothetical protein NNL38_20130 [Photobacterium atrarenae]
MAAIENSNLYAGITAFDGLTFMTQLDGCFVIIETDQDFYTYRGVVKKRVEYNVVYNHGLLSSAIKYSLENVKITKVTAIKISQTKLNIDGLALIESDISNVPNGVLVQCEDSTRVSCDVSFITTGNKPTENNTRLRFERCCYLRINDLYTDYPLDNEDGTYGYSFSLFDSYDIRVANAKSDGYGWGVDGSGNVQRLSFENCALSRIDAHQPFREYLKVSDSTIGNWGLTLVGIGDLILDNVDFVQRNGSKLNGIVTSRLDCGGFIDGRFVGRNITINGNHNKSSFPPVLNCETHENQALPQGSPIAPRFFSSVEINGISTPLYEGGLNVISAGEVGNNSLLFPRLITVRDVNTLKGDLNVDPAIRVLGFSTEKFTSDESIGSSQQGPYNTKLVLDNVNVDWLIVSGDNSEINVECYANYIGSGDRYETPNVEIKQKGRYEFISSKLGNLLTGFGYNDSVFVLNGGSIKSKGTFSEDSYNRLVWVNGSKLQLNHVDVTFKDAVQQANLNKAVMNNCNVFDGGGNQVHTYLLHQFLSGTSESITEHFIVGNTYKLITGLDADNTSSSFTFVYNGDGVYYVPGVGGGTRIISSGDNHQFVSDLPLRRLSLVY